MILPLAHDKQEDHWRERGSQSIYNVTTTGEWYQWMENIFTKSAYWDSNILGARGYTQDGGFYRLGSIRLRMQLKGSCNEKQCVSGWSSPYVSSHFSERRGFPTAGTFSWYDESGYIVYLPPTRPEALILLQSLKTSSWISQATSAVFVEMPLYNPSTNTFVATKFISEFSDFCEVQSVISTSPLHVLFRNSTQEAILFIVLGLYVIGLVLLLREIFRAYVEECSAPSLSYNTILAVFMTGSFVSHLTRILEVNNLRNNLLEKTAYIDMNTLTFITSMMMVCYGLASFFLVMRSILVFKFFRIINIFHTVINIAFSNILHFSIFFIFTILIFALAGMLMFGSKVLVFSSFTKSVMSLLAVLTHNMQFLQFQKVAPYLAPIYFMIFYGVTYLILCRIVVAIFIRTMFELRRSKVDREQQELATFLWSKFQEWLWEEDEEKKKRKNITPKYDVVSTKVEEMDAFVNALLRTVEAGSERKHSGRSGPSSQPTPSLGHSSRPTSVPDPVASSDSVPHPKSAPTKAVYISGKGHVISNSNASAEDFSGLEDYNSPPLSPKKALKSSQPHIRPKPSIEDTSFSFITPMKPLSPHTRKPKASRSNKSKSKNWKDNDIPVIDPDENGYDVSENPEQESSKISFLVATTVPENRMESFPLKPIPPSKELPDSMRMIRRVLSPNLPSSIQQIVNKRAELPPLEKTHAKFKQEIDEISLSTRVNPTSRYTDDDRPIFGGTAVLTPVELIKPSSPSKNERDGREEMEEDLIQQYRMQKIIRAIRDMAGDETASTGGEHSEAETQEESYAADVAFNQLREHLKRGDTCPDVIIKSILTEIERPQTTPEETQRQTALLAEQLKKAGWDDPPFVQRELTEMSLFSLLTRESSQASEWLSMSRESTLEGGDKLRPCPPNKNPDSEESVLPDNVSALIRRALVQVSNGISPMEAQDTPVERADLQPVDRSGPHSSGSDDNSPTGPPEPIYTENTFIFKRDF